MSKNFSERLLMAFYPALEKMGSKCNIFSKSCFLRKSIGNRNRKSQSYSDLINWNVKLVRFIGWKCTPFKPASKNAIIYTGAANQNSVFFLAAAILHSVLFGYGLILNWKQLRNYSAEDSKLKGTLLELAILNLHVSGVSMVGLWFMARKKRQFVPLFNLLCNFDNVDLGLGRIDSQLMRFFVQQMPVVTLGSSLMYAVTLISALESSLHLSLIRGIAKISISVLQWWGVTWATGLCTLSGFCGLFVAYGAIYIGSKSVLR